MQQHATVLPDGYDTFSGRVPQQRDADAVEPVYAASLAPALKAGR